MTANDVRTRIWAVDTIGQYFTRVDSITAHCSIIILQINNYYAFILGQNFTVFVCYKNNVAKTETTGFRTEYFTKCSTETETETIICKKKRTKTLRESFN